MLGRLGGGLSGGSSGCAALQPSAAALQIGAGIKDERPCHDVAAERCVKEGWDGMGCGVGWGGVGWGGVGWDVRGGAGWGGKRCPLPPLMPCLSLAGTPPQRTCHAGHHKRGQAPAVLAQASHPGTKASHGQHRRRLLLASRLFCGRWGKDLDRRCGGGGLGRRQGGAGALSILKVVDW